MASSKLDPALNEVALRIQQYLGGKTAREIAEDTGVHPETVRRYLTGMPPSLEFVIALGRKYNLSLNWLLLGVGTIHLSDQATSLDSASSRSLVDELRTRVRVRADRMNGAVETLAAEFTD